MCGVNAFELWNVPGCDAATQKIGRQKYRAYVYDMQSAVKSNPSSMLQILLESSE